MDKTSLLGEFLPVPYSFPELDTALSNFQTKNFIDSPFHIRFLRVNEFLLNQIQKAPDTEFLLPAVIQFLERINRDKIFDRQFNLAHFEFWLNLFSGLSESDNLKIRGKIMGKMIPREAYQLFFPIGMGMVFPNTHIVTAHLTPDVDTMIASFWGWVDAFAARISEGLHLWSLPGGAPESPVTTQFGHFFGINCFDATSRSAPRLTLAAIDLINNANLNKKHGATPISTLDHGISERAVILIDEKGHFLGDWRSTDVELVRQVVIIFKSVLRLFENNIHSQLIQFFAKQKLHAADIDSLLHHCFNVTIDHFTKELSDAQRKKLESFLRIILDLDKALKTSFTALIQALEKAGAPSLHQFQKELEKIPESGLFDSSGIFVEDRPKIFHFMEMISGKLNHAIHEVRNWVERLDVSMQIKEKVLGIVSESIQLDTDVDVIRNKMGYQDYLTVTIPESSGKQFPVGIVWSKDLRQNVLGTVSFRDFCNFEEVKMASYLAVISVIDHHKASLKTIMPPLAIIGDAQSCNVLVAEQTMKINDQFSLLGLTADEIQEKLQLSVEGSPRLIERLMRRRLAADLNNNAYVNPLREFAEYLFFLHAILDDTDLLTKVTGRDVLCSAELLNRLKSIQLKQDVEIITLDDIPDDSSFAKAAAKRILQNEDMYSIYSKTNSFRQKEIEKNLQSCIEGKSSDLFADAKVQNGCCRISQTKLFSNNFNFYLKHHEQIQRSWAQTAQEIQTIHPEWDLHIHMISTIASADEVYHGKTGAYKHQDELWFWTPDTDQARNRLANFLSNFQQSPEMMHNDLSLEIIQPEVEQIFKRNFLPIPTITKRAVKGAAPSAILRFNAGSLNSRKAMVSPYLPQAVS